MRLPFQLRIGCWETKNLAGVSHWVMLTLYRKATRHLSPEFLLPFSTRAFKVRAWFFLIEITQRKIVRSVCSKPVSMATWRLHTLWRFTFTAYWFDVNKRLNRWHLDSNLCTRNSQFYVHVLHWNCAYWNFKPHLQDKYTVDFDSKYTIRSSWLFRKWWVQNFVTKTKLCYHFKPNCGTKI